MASRDQPRMYFLMFGGIFFLMSVLHLSNFFRQPSDIWWTPNTIRVPITEARDRIQVYVGGAPLLEELGAGRLFVAGTGEPVPLRESEVSVRFNNWDLVRAQRIPALASYAAGAGASAVILLLGILGWTPRRDAVSGKAP